jgi:hypothetical protein
MLILALLAAGIGLTGSMAAMAATAATAANAANAASNDLLVTNNTDQKVMAVLSTGVVQSRALAPKASWNAVGGAKSGTITFKSADGKKVLAAQRYQNAQSATLVLTPQGYQIQFEPAAAASHKAVAGANPSAP